MPEKVSILLSHVVSHLVEYSSLKTMFALKALPQYLLTPDVNNFHVKVSSFLCWYFFFFCSLKLKNFSLHYFIRLYLSLLLLLFLWLDNWLPFSIPGIIFFTNGNCLLFLYFPLSVFSVLSSDMYYSYTVPSAFMWVSLSISLVFSIFCLDRFPQLCFQITVLFLILPIPLFTSYTRLNIFFLTIIFSLPHFSVSL